VLLGSLAFEGITRLAGIRLPGIPAPGDQGDRGLWVYDANLGWFHAPHSRGRSFEGGPDAGQVRINGLGLRGPEVSRDPLPGASRVLVLGDSFVFGVGVDEEHLFSSELQRRLGRGYEVVNLGVSGYSTDQELLLFESLGASLQPSVVLLVMCDNDFTGNTQDFVYHAYYKPRFDMSPAGLIRHNQPVPRLSPSEEARLWLGRHSNTWKLLRRATASFETFEPFAVARSGPARPDVELAFRLVATLRHRAQEAGASFAVFNTGHRGEQTKLFHALRVHLRREGLTFLGLEDALSRARGERPNGLWDFGQNTHWNVDAHRVAAEVVHGFLVARGLLNTARRSPTPRAGRRSAPEGP
jgi:hypothetical protein